MAGLLRSTSPLVLIATLLVATEALGPVADVAWICLVTVALLLG
jgi:hypothetical protein